MMPDSGLWLVWRWFQEANVSPNVQPMTKRLRQTHLILSIPRGLSVFSGAQQIASITFVSHRT